MLNLGLTEIIVIVVLAIVVVGPDRLPEMMRFVGKQYGKLMRASHDLRRAFMLEADKMDAQKRAEELRRRRAEVLRRAVDGPKNPEIGKPHPPHLPRTRPAAGDAGDAAVPAELDDLTDLTEAAQAEDPPQPEAAAPPVEVERTGAPRDEEAAS